MTAVLVVLIAAVAFISWACVHVYRRTNWHQDEVDMAAFVTAPRKFSSAASEGSRAFADLNAAMARLAAANAKARRDMAANQ